MMEGVNRKIKVLKYDGNRKTIYLPEAWSGCAVYWREYVVVDGAKEHACIN
jgi:hypothetical protein